MAQATLDIPELHRVTLVNDEYLSEHGGRLKAGTVVLVDDKTARRWLDRGIAVPASETDKTLREQKLAELERIKAELEALNFKLAIFPITAMLASVQAMTQVYKHFKNTGSSVGGQTDLYDFTDLTKLMGFEEVWDFDKKHAD